MFLWLAFAGTPEAPAHPLNSGVGTEESVHDLPGKVSKVAKRIVRKEKKKSSWVFKHWRVSPPGEMWKPPGLHTLPVR